MLIDTINQDMIVADIKKTAKLCADFKNGDEQIFVNKGNKKETITITDAIRQAEYRYTYADRSQTTERSNKADITAEAVDRFARAIPLNIEEFFTWYMEQKGVENPERFLQTENTIPIEIQQLLLQDPRIQALVADFEQRKAGGAGAIGTASTENGTEEAKTNQQEVPNTIPDSTIPEAQPQE